MTRRVLRRRRVVPRPVIESCQAWYQVESVQERGYEGFVANDESADYSGGPHALAAQGEAAELSRQRMRPGPEEQIVNHTLPGLV